MPVKKIIKQEIKESDLFGTNPNDYLVLATHWAVFYRWLFNAYSETLTDMPQNILDVTTLEAMTYTLKNMIFREILLWFKDSCKNISQWISKQKDTIKK